MRIPACYKSLLFRQQHRQGFFNSIIVNDLSRFLESFFFAGCSSFFSFLLFFLRGGDGVGPANL